MTVQAMSPMEDYRRKAARVARIERKQDKLRERRDVVRDRIRGLPVADKGSAEKSRELWQEYRGLIFDLEQMHAEIIATWRA